MRKVIRITDFMGDTVPLENYRFWFVGNDYAYAYIGNSSFMKMFSNADGYTVTTMEV